MIDLQGHQRDWEDLARLDPLWAILTEQDKRFGNWGMEEFFSRGRSEVASLMQTASQLGLPHGRESALDFGCGVGRLTRALSEYFPSCCGVDISISMIDRARELTPSCKFHVNERPDLGLFADQSFDLVYTSRVLQHLPSVSLIAGYIAELIRVLRPGGLFAFQLPQRIPLRNQIQPRRRAYAFLRKLGVAPTTLHSTLTLHPMRMRAIPENEVGRIVTVSGGRLVKVSRDDFAGPGIDSRTYCVTR